MIDVGHLDPNFATAVLLVLVSQALQQAYYLTDYTDLLPQNLLLFR